MRRWGWVGEVLEGAVRAQASTYCLRHFQRERHSDPSWAHGFLLQQLRFVRKTFPYRAEWQVSGKHSPKVRDLDLNPYRSWSTCYLNPPPLVRGHFRISGSVSPLRFAMNQECEKQPLLCYHATGCWLCLPEMLNLAHTDSNCLPNHISVKRTDYSCAPLFLN